MVDEGRVKADKVKADKANENRGRSAEARDPNRPIDPVTGEKEGLGPRNPVIGTPDGEPQV